MLYIYKGKTPYQMASFVQFRQIRRKTERMRNHLKLGFYSLANTPLFKFIFFFLGIAHFWHRINLRPATHTFYSWPKCKVCTIMLPTIPDSQHLSPNPWEFQLSVPIPARNEAGIPGAGHVVISGARHRRR